LIFERLYQDPNAIDDSRKGLGLGLYISKELVRLHGGQIWVESQLSHGSTFVFTLPLFSLARFLAPVITYQGRLRNSLSLILVALAPLHTTFPGSWDDIRRHCLQILEPCILGDKDVILPALGHAGSGETIGIVVSANEHGASVIEKRIREQLRALQPLAGKLCLRTFLPGPAVTCRRSPGPVDKLVQEVADSTTEMIMATLQRNQASPN